MPQPAQNGISDVLVEPIDVPSLLHYSVNASEREVNTLRGVVDGLVAASPRLHAQAEAVRARTRIAVRVQRAWRRRRRVWHRGGGGAHVPARRPVVVLRLIARREVVFIPCGRECHL